MPTAITYTTDEAAAHTGATTVQIAHLVRQGAIVPAEEAPRRGISREFSAWQLVELILAVELIKSGIPVSSFNMIFRKIRRDRAKEPDRHLLVLWVPGPPVCGGPRLSTTERIYLPTLTTPEQLITAVVTGDVIGFVMDIRPAVAAVERVAGQTL